MSRSLRLPSILHGTALVLLGGCTLLGARDFSPATNAPPRVLPPPAGPAARPVPALVVIRFPSPASVWAGPLDVAVGLARSRKPDVLFIVQTAVGAPAAADPTATASALARAAADGAAVGDRIVADGADRLQVQLTAVADPALPPGREEVRVFVR